MPRDLVPIVQQQLDALSTQNYAWQGQIWPGQQMQWEIGENPDGARSTENDAIARWQTRLKLVLPMPVSYTHLRAHETVLDLVCRLLLEKKTEF